MQGGEEGEGESAAGLLYSEGEQAYVTSASEFEATKISFICIASIGYILPKEKFN